MFIFRFQQKYVLILEIKTKNWIFIGDFCGIIDFIESLYFIKLFLNRNQIYQRV